MCNIGNPQQGQENRNPLPNPWSAGVETSTSTDRSEENASRTSGNAAGGLFGSSSMQNLMQQIMQNPQTMQNMLSAPYMQSFLQAMAADPDLASNIIGSNPMFASNPELQV